MTFKNTLNLRGAKSVFFGKLANRNALLLPYGINSFLRNLGGWIGCTKQRLLHAWIKCTTLSCFVQHILALSPLNQMFRIYAPRLIASVHYHIAVFNRAIKHFISQTMSVDDLACTKYMKGWIRSIIIALPHPASRIGNFDAGHKSLMNFVPNNRIEIANDAHDALLLIVVMFSHCIISYGGTVVKWRSIARHIRTAILDPVKQK